MTKPDALALADVTAKLAACLRDCVEDSQAEVDRYVQSYGENFRPARLAAMRKQVADAREALAAYEQAQAEPMNMALCEATKVVLREGQLYRFRRVGDCETCAELSKQSLEAYGQPPKENNHD